MLAGLSTRPYTENIFNVFIGQCPMLVKSGWGRSGQPGPPLTASDIEENRFVVALDTDVEAVGRGPLAGLLVGNQRPTAIRRYHGEDRIGGVGRLVREVQPRVDLPQHAAREDTDHD